jgi:NAD(P)H dehydrogenase (quinone)
MATRKPKILITGATGQVGREVLKRLTDDKALDVAASSRAPAKAADLGVPVVLLDYDRRETIAPALEGVDRLFILTAYTVDMLRQSKALVDQARKSGVKHIVHLGGCGADDTDVARYGWHQFVERYIAGSGIEFTHLRPEIFMQNLFGYGGVRVVENGVIRHYVGHARLSWIEIRRGCCGRAEGSRDAQGSDLSPRL